MIAGTGVVVMILRCGRAVFDGHEARRGRPIDGEGIGHGDGLALFSAEFFRTVNGVLLGRFGRPGLSRLDGVRDEKPENQSGNERGSEDRGSSRSAKVREIGIHRSSGPRCDACAGKATTGVDLRSETTACRMGPLPHRVH
jgi:hypothetical protein